MGEYVEIRTGVAEIINLANTLRTSGERLTSAVQGANSEIVQLEAGPETLPHDDFAEQFLSKYHEMVPGPEGDEDVEANAAVRLSATNLASTLTELGNFVAGSMFAYNASDDGNARDITNTSGE